MRWKIYGLDFLGLRLHPSHRLSSKVPNHRRGVLLISTGASEGHFEGKTAREFHKGVLVFARQCPGPPDTCKPEESGLPEIPMSSDQPPCSPDLAP
jgi:hypothetical protein